jgi:methionyl-tRNA formyltransferase
LHKIDRGIDTGDLLDQNTFELTDTDRSQDCYRKYLNSSKDLLSRNFNQLAGNQILQCYSQSYEKSSYYSKNSIDFSSLRIDFKKTAWQIKRFVYAFSFRPYQLLKFNGRDIVDILITKNQSRLNPGQIIRDYGDQAVVSTIDYDIHIIFDNLDNFLFQIPTITLAEFKVKIMNTLGINDRNKLGWSPIIVASFNGRLDIVDFLLTQGANINDRNNNGTTVLMYAKDFALKSCNKEIIQFLLEKGADVNLLDFHGKSVLEYLTKSEASFLGLNK